ncbi:MAG: TrkH family potassium uptake protein [Acidimicrobiales bacterium]
MTGTARPPGRRVSVYAGPVTIALASSGGALVVAALIDLTDGGHDALALAVVGALSLAVAAGLHRRFEAPASYRSVQSLSVLTVVWLTMIAVGAIALAFTDIFVAQDGTDRWTAALFESTSGFTTTGMTALPVVQDAGRGVLFFRAASNWLGGLAALITVVAVLPFVTRTRDLVATDKSREAARALAPRIDQGMSNVTRLYGVFTVVTIVAFALTGIGIFDSVAYGLAVVSTGGFSTHSSSLWSEQNAAAEWVAIGAMFLAGTSMAILWWLMRGAIGSMWRSMELRVYAAMVVAATIIVSIGIAGPDEVTGSRQAVFAVASTMSTTGLVAFDWWSWGAGAQVILVLLLAIGPMSGSAAGGFKILRVMVLWEVGRRELVRLVYPRAVHVAKIGGRPLRDRTVQSVAGYLILHIALVLGGAYAVGLFEDGVRRSLVAALSAVSTSGLLLGVRTADELTEGGRLVLLPLMLAGRLAILPLFVTVERAAASSAAFGRRVVGRVRT